MTWWLESFGRGEPPAEQVEAVVAGPGLPLSAFAAEIRAPALLFERPFEATAH